MHTKLPTALLTWCDVTAGDFISDHGCDWMRVVSAVHKDTWTTLELEIPMSSNRVIKGAVTFPSSRAISVRR